MSQQKSSVNCPNCGHDIDVNELLYHQVNQELKKQFDDDLAKEKQNYDDQLGALAQQKQDFEAEKKKQEESVSKAIEDGLKAEQIILEKRLKLKIEEEQSERLKSLEDELNEKSGQLKEFNKAKSEIERLKREKDEMKDSIEAESEIRHNKIIAEEKEKIRKTEEEKAQMKLSEREKVIEQLNEQLKEAQRKAEQGSMQLQGEVQELGIEDWLRSSFPLDNIEEIKKGARGADCLQIVNTRGKPRCGTIYYESKRTKAFQPSWIEKFKQDIREKNADIGVLVSESMPTDMDRMGQKDGIWICSFEEFKGLSVALRETIIAVSLVTSSQENKGDKMEMLYNYLTGNEFKLQIEAIVEGFSQMKSDLESEKRAMASIWKKRDKQIDKVLLNTTHLHGSIKGIAGNAIQAVPMLELQSG